MCLVIFHKRLDCKYPAVVLLSGMQLLCEVSHYPEILNEIHSQVQEPCTDAWGYTGWEKGFRILSSLILLHCSFGGSHCYVEAERGEPTPPATSVAQMLQLFTIVVKCPDPAKLQLWHLLPHPLISVALVIF